MKIERLRKSLIASKDTIAPKITTVKKKKTFGQGGKKNFNSRVTRGKKKN